MQHQDSLNAYILQSVRDNWEQLALTDFNGVSFQYKDVARKIAKLHLLFEHAGVGPGDRVAICGRNSAQWAVAFLGIITYGAVAVPILNEFKPDNIHHLVSHSEAKLLFADAAVWENLDSDCMSQILGAIQISDYSLMMSRSEALTHARANLNRFFGEKYPERFDVGCFDVALTKPGDLALINYTSGSTGFSKGVMLPERSLWSNVEFTIDRLDFLQPGDGVVCMLPLAHMYGLTVELLHPFVKGCHINFLTRTPSPRVIMEAFASVKPKMIVSVPLIIEKIIKTKVFPLLDKPMMKLLMHVPFVDNHLLAKIKARLADTFGGNVVEIIIGGAALNKDVEEFLRRIEFPFTVGYGMTECGPLISYTPWREFVPGSSGRTLPCMESKILSDDPENVPGEICVRGTNVMKGYYKNREATDAVLDAEGWLHTGDMGTRSADGTLFIKGRYKTMILSASGQNIYPEEIEAKLNNMAYVSESLIVERGKGLTALVYPDYERMDADRLTVADLSPIMERNRNDLNQLVAPYERVDYIQLTPQEFEKTPKKSIKRYLYS